jgi:protein-S-isoprenylcysteine O-methyltransferase Ste14
VAGWTIFYGSIAVLIALVLWWVFFAFIQIPTEERQLEARFGETYLRYTDAVSRWFRLPGRR